MFIYLMILKQDFQNYMYSALRQTGYLNIFSDMKLEKYPDQVVTRLPTAKSFL